MRGLYSGLCTGLVFRCAVSGMMIIRMCLKGMDSRHIENLETKERRQTPVEVYQILSATAVNSPSLGVASPI